MTNLITQLAEKMGGLTAQPQSKFYIGAEALQKPAVHHQSFKHLWETKWKKPCEMGVYPFMFGSVQDFEPIVQELVQKDMKEPYDWDEYAKTFFPHAERLVQRAEEAEKAGEQERASEYYLRASAVYRISRFPIMRSERQKYAWGKGKEACLKGLKMRPSATIEEVQIPHTHGLPNEGEGSHIPVYCSIPSSASEDKPCPCVTIMTGLDGYRTELAVWIQGWNDLGVGCIVVEIPGTGDSPAAKNDPTSPDRQWSSYVDWLDEQKMIDPAKRIVWAFSTGGYYAIRLAHQKPDKFAGIVALGGGCHHMFDPEWTDNVNHLEYPFDLAGALAYKFGYGNDIAKYRSEAHKFSLLNDGTLDKPDCGRLLLVNGTLDEIFPIDDYQLCLEHGAPKEARFVTGKKHMGEPDSFFIILKWIYAVLGFPKDRNPVDQLKKLPFKAKY